MTKKILVLILNVVVFVLWMIFGIYDAVNNPTWRLLIYGGVIATTFLMCLYGIEDLVDYIKDKHKRLKGD